MTASSNGGGVAILQERGGAGQGLAGLAALPAARVLSLDVFDTMLVRDCGAPEALYLWLGRRLRRRGLVEVEPERFARARHRAELDVWAREGGLDAPVTLADFYRELVPVLGLDAGLLETLVDEELSLEEETLRPAPHAAELLALADARDLRVVFTSDTYFSAAFIRRQLERHGLWPEGARCFSSSDAGASKESGRLFDAVAQELGVATWEIVHAGDNRDCDVRAARRAGAEAEWLTAGRLDRYERLLSDARWETGGLSAAFAGASRLARLRTPARGPHEEALRDVAAGVAAPVLAGYVLWLLHRARDLGLERLYFVARDGQLLADVASRLVQRLGWGPEARYLLASRRSINLAAMEDTSAADLEWAFRKTEAVTFGDLLGRLDLERGAVSAELASAGLGALTPASPVTTDVRDRLEAAVRSGPLRKPVLARADARRELVLPYLRQEGLLDGVRIGIADIGGVGSQARALHLLCTRGGTPAPRFFFVGLDAHPDPEQADVIRGAAWLDDAECYLFDLQRGRGIRPFRGLITSVQMFCAADHGTVLTYERRGDRIEPVLEDAGAVPVRAWGLEVVQATVREFVDSVVLDDDLLDRRAPVRAAVCDVVREFVRRPTAGEARAWAAFPFEGSEVTGVRTKPLAEPYTWPGVLRAVLGGSALRGSFPDLSWTSWHEGATAMSPPLLRESLRRVERLYLRVRSSNDPRARAAMAAARWLRRKSR